MQDYIKKAIDYYINSQKEIYVDDTINYDFYDDSYKMDYFFDSKFIDKVFIEETLYKNDKEYILITGATGYLGNHILKKIIDNHPEKKILILTRKPLLPKISDSIEYIYGSMLDLLDLDKRFKKISQIYHLAAYVKHDNTLEVWNESKYANLYASIIIYFLAYFNKAKFVYLSTSGIIAHDLSFIEDMPYYKTKNQVENIFKNLIKTYPIKIIILRPSMMLGPKINLFNLDDIYERNIINKIKNHYILFNGSGVVNFVDIRYVADFCYKIFLKDDFPNEITSYNLMGPNLKIGDFFRKVSEINEWKKIYIPNFLAWIMSLIGVLKSTEYTMTTIGWYYRHPDMDEFLTTCQKELQFANIDYYKTYPIQETLKYYN